MTLAAGDHIRIIDAHCNTILEFDIWDIIPNARGTQDYELVFNPAKE